MTEDEWQTSSSPGPMYDWLESTRGTSLRKKRLFVCAACRGVWDHLRLEVRRLVEAAEDLYDRALVERSDPSIQSRIHDALLSLSRVTLAPIERTVVYLVASPLDGGNDCLGVVELAPVLTPRAVAELLREQFGNPFRKTRWVGSGLRGRIDTWPREQQPADLLLVREWLGWEGGLIPALARAIYDERGWDRLPILADALEDAGCGEASLLEHLRHPGLHARGCWSLDLLLGLD